MTKPPVHVSARRPSALGFRRSLQSRRSAVRSGKGSVTGMNGKNFSTDFRLHRDRRRLKALTAACSDCEACIEMDDSRRALGGRIEARVGIRLLANPRADDLGVSHARHALAPGIRGFPLCLGAQQRRMRKSPREALNWLIHPSRGSAPPRHRSRHQGQRSAGIGQTLLAIITCKRHWPVTGPEIPQRSGGEQSRVQHGALWVGEDTNCTFELADCSATKDARSPTAGTLAGGSQGW